jgi:hypothetical protein
MGRLVQSVYCKDCRSEVGDKELLNEKGQCEACDVWLCPGCDRELKLADLVIDEMCYWCSGFREREYFDDY